MTSAGPGDTRVSVPVATVEGTRRVDRALVSDERCRRRRLSGPERKNYAEIERLEQLLADLRGDKATARETEAIREIGLEIALAIREVGAMLVNVGWEQTFATDRKPAAHSQQT